MHFAIDASLYPDVEVPKVLSTQGQRIDYLARLCSAWDFGILPEQSVVDEIRRTEWREAVDACRLLTSPVYHLIRSWHGLEPLPYLGRKWKYILEDPYLSRV